MMTAAQCRVKAQAAFDIAATAPDSRTGALYEEHARDWMALASAAELQDIAQRGMIGRPSY